MALNEKKKALILSSLKSRIKGTCPMCNASNWAIDSDVVAAQSSHDEAGAPIGGRYIPLVQMICLNCGFVSLHAIGALGVKHN
jgi:hypothetical protein